jgi:hypothetical protein
MEQTITTIRDAERVISDWTYQYLEQPTEKAFYRAARRLVGYVGGYGHILTDELAESFDVDAALDGVYSGDIRERIRQAWADDREMVNYWVPDDVRQRGDLDLGNLDEVLAAIEEMHPGYLDQTQV